MLVYATEFPTRSGHSAQEFVRLCQAWLVGSPNNAWEGNDFGDVPKEEILRVDRHGQTVQFGVVEIDSEPFAAFHYQWEDEESRVWASEFVARETSAGLWVSIRLHCNVRVAGQETLIPKKPYIIRQILDEFGGGTDGGLTISDEPRRMRADEVGFAAAAISADLGNRLPVVYVSAGFDGRHALNPTRLAQLLSGSAHVLVEPSRAFSLRLMHQVSSQNAYGGAIGIYWPGGQLAADLFSRGTRSEHQLVAYLIERIRVAFCQAQPTDLSTWMAIRELVARKRTQALRNSGSADLDQYAEAFDEELRVKSEQLDEANREVQRLRAEIRAAGRVHRSGESGLIAEGREQDLFPGERAEIVRSALRTSLEGARDDSRTAHVIRDILPTDQGLSSRSDMAERIKRCFEGKRRLGSREISDLKDLGFQISEEGKHYKAVFRDDPRYTFTIPKTSSDHRAGLNIASTINNALFK